MSRKAICTICRAIFKIRELPPLEIVEDPGFNLDGTPADPYVASAIELNNSMEAMRYSRLNCPVCRLDSPWSEDESQVH